MNGVRRSPTNCLSTLNFTLCTLHAKEECPMLIQGSNDPIVVTFDQSVANVPQLAASL